MENRKSKILFIISLILFLMFMTLCFACIYFSMMYDNNYKTDLGRFYADIAMTLACLPIVIPIMPIGEVLNIIAYTNSKKYKNSSFTRFLLLWSFAFPVICAILWCIAIVYFVGLTGGV